MYGILRKHAACNNTKDHPEVKKHGSGPTGKSFPDLPTKETTPKEKCRNATFRGTERGVDLKVRVPMICFWRRLRPPTRENCVNCGPCPVQERWGDVGVDVDVQQLGRVLGQRPDAQHGGDDVAIEGVQIDLQQIQAAGACGGLDAVAENGRSILGEHGQGHHRNVASATKALEENGRRTGLNHDSAPRAVEQSRALEQAVCRVGGWSTATSAIHGPQIPQLSVFNSPAKSD